RLPYNELLKVLFQGVRYLHSSGFCTFSITHEQSAFTVTGFYIAATDIGDFGHSQPGTCEQINCHPFSYRRNLTTFDVKGGPVTNSAPKEFYLLVTVILNAVDVLNLAGSFQADFFPRAWKLDNSAGL